MDTDQLKELEQMIAATATDADLAQAWCQGDDRAYSAIVDRYGPMIQARCARVLPPADADDATQAVFLILLRRAPQAAASPKLAAWLLRVADNVCRNAHRDRRRRLKRQGELLVEPVQHGSSEEERDMSQLKAHLDAAIAALPKREQQAVRLHHLAGHSYAEIAADLGIAASTVASRAQKGLERLRGILAKRGVSASMALLLALLARPGEAAGNLAIIRSWDPSAVGAGATATAPSAQALRWSRKRLSLMSKFALAGAASLLVVSAVALPHLFSEEEPVSPQSASTEPIETEALTELPEFFYDTEVNKTLTVIEITDPNRTWQRFLTAPEALLIQAETKEQIGEVMATIGGLKIAMDPTAMFNAEAQKQNQAIIEPFMRSSGAERAQAFHKQIEEQQQAGHTIHRPHLRGLWTFRDTGENRVEKVMDMVEAALAPILMNGQVSIDGKEPESLGVSVTMPWIQYTLEDGDKHAAAQMPKVDFPRRIEDDQGWLSLERTETSLELQAGPAHDDYPWIWENHPLVTEPLDEDTDFAVVSILENPDSGDSVRAFEGTATFVDGDLSIRSHQAWTGKADRSRSLELTLLDTTLLTEFPADTIAAAAISLDNEAFGDNAFLMGLLMPALATSNEAWSGRAVIEATLSCLLKADGAMLVAVRERPFLPALQVELPTDEAAAEAFLKALDDSGFRKGKNGQRNLPMPLGMVTLSVAWVDDRLILSTDTQGIAPLLGSDTTLADLPSVAATLAEMPASSGLQMALIRRDALVAQFAPLAGASDPVAAKMLNDWLIALREAPQNDWFLTWRGDEGWHVDAEGAVTGAIAVGGGASVAQGLQALSADN